MAVFILVGDWTDLNAFFDVELGRALEQDNDVMKRR